MSRVISGYDAKAFAEFSRGLLEARDSMPRLLSHDQKANRRDSALQEQ
jgi:hypothetical protein